MATMDPKQILPKMIHLRAESGGHRGRSIRLDGGRVPLATCTYNFNQSDQTKEEVASRIAVLWNLAKGLSLADLEAIDAANITISRLLDIVVKKGK